jgi:hypothetical protein
MTYSIYPISARKNSRVALMPSLLTLQGAFATQNLRDAPRSRSSPFSSASCKSGAGLKGSVSSWSSLRGCGRKARLHWRAWPWLRRLTDLSDCFEMCCQACCIFHFLSSWDFSAPRKRLKIPKRKRKKMVNTYVVGVVVVHSVNHRVTRVLVENVEAMPDMSIAGMEAQRCISIRRA